MAEEAELGTPPLNAVPTQVHPTEEFDRALDAFFDEIEGSDPDSEATLALVEEFEDELAAAITHLKQNPHAVKPHGLSGLEFSSPISEAFSLIVMRATDRTGSGAPLNIHFYLLAIERNR
ncbi:MAG: hypothetical protein ABSC15_19745 [Terriglobales bacterium]